MLARVCRPTTMRLGIAPECRAASRRSLATTAPPRRSSPPLLDFSPEVESAIGSGNGSGVHRVVALESTIITHGMPYPTNLEAAGRVEDAVRSQGAVPATIAVIDGRIKVGLSESELQRVAESPMDKTRKAVKAGTRELAYVVGQRNIIGGTTVSGTSAVCDMAGISTFATGGIGGVHRGGETTFDISSDLTTLGKTPINVFCSGAKSILDIPRTLEFLETHGVGVYSLNPSGEFPAFFTSKSGHFVPSVSSIETIARIIEASRQLQSRQGTIWAVPIPSQYEEKGALIQQAVEQAVRESHEQGIDARGKEATPWLLARVNELTRGESLKSNVELVVNNATTAARVAVQLARLSERGGSAAGYSVQQSAPIDLPPALVVFGCAAIDIVTQMSHHAPGSTSPGTVSLTSGGVGNNIAQAAANVLRGAGAGGPSSGPHQVRLVAPVLDDLPGELLRRAVQEKGLSSDGLFAAPAKTKATQAPTSTSPPTLTPTTPMVVLNLDGQNDLVDGVASTSLVETALDAKSVTEQLSRTGYLRNDPAAKTVVMDGNLSPAAMAELIRWRCEGGGHSRSLIFETTSTAKCVRVIDAIKEVKEGPASALDTPCVDLITPNMIELEKLVARALELGLVSGGDAEEAAAKTKANDNPLLPHTLERARHLCTVLFPLFPTILVTLGARGVFSARRDRSTSVDSHSFQHHPLNPLHLPREIVSTTGAGDSFTGAVCAYAVARAARARGQAQDGGDDAVGVLFPDDEAVAEAVQVGQLASACSLEVWDPVAWESTEERCGALMRAFAEREREGSGRE